MKVRCSFNDKLYWWVKYNEIYFCFILINGYENGQWTVWFADGDSDCFSDFPSDERTKKISWVNVDIFKGDSNSGQCEGLRKVIFGKEFESLYRMLLCFHNPDSEAVVCMKNLVMIIKNEFSKNNTNL